MAFLSWIGFEIGHLDEVREVFVSRVKDPSKPDRTIVKVWTVLREDTVEARLKVYKCEENIGRVFPEDEFDFFATNIAPQSPALLSVWSNGDS